MGAQGKLRIIEGGFAAFCPACQEYHKIIGWVFNGDFDRPTFSPSLRVQGVVNAENDPTPTVCHSFIENGNWRFLGDCTHSMARQIVALRSEVE